MDVINKLYYTVSSTVSQISHALPGNAVTKEYEIYENIGSAGPGLFWKIYNGMKKSTKQEASIFVFERKILDKWSKDEREIMLEILRKSVIQLTKIRHPRVLTVQHPLEESRDSLAFATEPVYASLANLFGNFSNIQQPVPKSLSDFKLHDIEIKYGILQITEGLAFLHSDVKLLHKNITPESIVINKEGSWKIFGFDYCVLNQTPTEPHPQWPFQAYNSTWHCLTQPSLDYMAPENLLHSKHVPESDIFSLGVLIYCLHSVNNKPLKTFGKDIESCRRFMADLKNGRFPNLTCIPNGLSDYVRLMLNAAPEMRPSVYDISKINYFDDVGVKTLNYLDSLFQWDNLQKSKFYKGLPQILKEFPHRINMQHVLPCLIKEFVNPQMIPFVLPNVFLIASNCTKEEYQSHINAHLKGIMKVEEPIQILLILVQNIELLMKLTPTEDLKTDVLPMLYRAIETDTQQMQELCLIILPKFASFVEYATLKNGILPRIKKLCASSKKVSINVSCLHCIGKLLDHMDKWLVLDDIVPFLTQLKTREPEVIMGILGILQSILSHSKLGITKDVIATKIIPFLMPLCIENNLTLEQFDAVINMVKEMVAQVETEHRSKLEQLNSMKQVSRLSTYPEKADKSAINSFPALSLSPIEPNKSQLIIKSTSNNSVALSPTTPVSIQNIIKPINTTNSTTPTVNPIQPMSTSKPNYTINDNWTSSNLNNSSNMNSLLGDSQFTSWNKSPSNQSFQSYNNNGSLEKTNLLYKPAALSSAANTTVTHPPDNRPLLQPMNRSSVQQNKPKENGSVNLSAQDIIDFLK